MPLTCNTLPSLSRYASILSGSSRDGPGGITASWVPATSMIRTTTSGLSRRAIGDRRGHSHKHVERYAAGPEQSLSHGWQMGIEETAHARGQVVPLPEPS